jgi:hypothetical protein
LTHIEFNIDSTPNTTFRLEFFVNNACAPSGNGPGETFLHTATVATDASGTLPGVNVATIEGNHLGKEITATATDPAGNTSEFSACVTVEDDVDADNAPDSTDNCPTLFNPGQEDNDVLGGPFGGTQAWVADGTLPEGQHAGGDACDINDDNDRSCTDGEETGPNLAQGGQRDPLNPWDFGDVPTPALPAAGAARSGAVALTDVGAALAWVGAADGGGPNPDLRDYDDDDNANGVEDGAEYDRTPNGEISGPPNGAVSLSDVGVILAQVGDSCVAAPN